jgi:ketol-acid reductoisomerase
MTKKISDKLSKVNESFTINMYDNGFMVDIGGRDDEGDWTNTKIICSNVDEVIELIKEAADMPRND